MHKSHSIEELTGMLDSNFDNFDDQSIHEDLGIVQPDGSRACVNFELSGRGFHVCYDHEAGEIDSSYNPV